MQFDGLRDQTTLPADRLESAFEHEDVISVLPVTQPGSDIATVLVATPRKLGVATLRRLAGRNRWITRWAPWDAVRLRGRSADTASRAWQVRETIHIGGKRFRSALDGRQGQVALREFGRSAERRRAIAHRELTQTL